VQAHVQRRHALPGARHVVIRWVVNKHLWMGGLDSALAKLSQGTVLLARAGHSWGNDAH
jgi:hypothetical protein